MQASDGDDDTDEDGISADSGEDVDFFSDLSAVHEVEHLAEHEGVEDQSEMS